MYFKKTCTILLTVIALSSLFISTSCADSKNIDNTDSGITVGMPEPDKIVPTKDELIKNLNDNGYSVKTFDKILDTDISGERVYAEKGKKYIDICYGLSNSDAETLFKRYEEYKSGDYYIIAQNGNYVYAVSDKKTFKISGFESTDNVGQQYIHE
ncbi:MAG: hypothetical protein K2G63_00120 [Oscillospiraceae bacterium]|nr:hypothetical protein [Oscillospiraceae bacterium]